VRGVLNGSGAWRLSRRGFTLVEMLVSLALTLFMMVILSEAFAAGLEAFRQLKAVADMQEKLRTAAVILRRDLMANQYVAAQGTKLSDLDPQSTNPPPYSPPTAGFLRVWHVYQITNSAGGNSVGPSILEGLDADGVASFRMNAVNKTLFPTAGTDDVQILHFSVNLPTDPRPENYFIQPVDTTSSAGWSQLATLGQPALQQPNSFDTQYAEVAYFLGPRSGTTGTPRNSSITTPLPLYPLIRRELLAANSTADATSANTGGRPPFTQAVNSQGVILSHDRIFFNISCKQDPASLANPYLNGPTDLTVPERRFGITNSTGASGGMPVMPVSNTAQPPWTYPTINDQVAQTPSFLQANGGDDILLNDVVSFSVKILSPDYFDAVGYNNNPPPFGPSLTTTAAADFVDVPYQCFDPRLPAGNQIRTNSTFFDPLNGGAAATVRIGVFDTWCQQPGPPYDYHDPNNWGGGATAINNAPTTLPFPYKVTALQITIRVWDRRTQQTRQVTIVQNM
jgi:prepilin-type N-terminal cleavage/methylation domain-containing protein